MSTTDAKSMEEEGKQNMAHFLADSGVPAVAQESVLFGCEPIAEGTDEVHGYEFNDVSGGTRKISSVACCSTLHILWRS